MDRAVVFSTLLLIGLTWLLYKLTVWLEPRGESPPKNVATNVNSSQKLIHQRLRK